MAARSSLLFAWAFVVFLQGNSTSLLATEGEQVLVVFNRREHGSEAIARHYAARREVPESQVVGLRLPVTETMSRREFVEELQTPIATFLDDKGFWVRGQLPVDGTNKDGSPNRVGIVESRIRYLVLCRGVPLKIAADSALTEAAADELRPELRRNESAVDSELTCLPMVGEGFVFSGPFNNPCYGVTNPASIHPTNGVMMVTRLDGPTVEIARSLVDKAMKAEADGFWGRAYFDLRNPSEPGMKQGEDWFRSAAEICRLLGFETVVEESSATFRQGFPMSQIAVYAGWYAENVEGPFLENNVEFMPGALAYHLHSFSAASLRTASLHWVAPLLSKGATLSLGSVYEPYLAGTPDIATLVSRLYFMDFNYGQAACASQSVISWMTTVVGDPLFRPFRESPQAIHERLVGSDDANAEWSHLRIVNLNLVKGFPKAQVVLYLEEIPTTKQSAILTEKLADLYSELGKPSSALRSWQAALELDPSPQQKIRLQLKLGDKLTEAGQGEAAISMLTQLLKDHPDYPDAISVYRRLVSLAEGLSDASRMREYQQAIKSLTGS